MEEKYILIEVYGNEVICNCPYLNLDEAKNTLKASLLDSFITNKDTIEYGKNCILSDGETSAWAFINGKDRVWSIVKVPR